MTVSLTKIGGLIKQYVFNMGNHKYIPTPERMLELWHDYTKWAKENPVRVQDFVGKDGEEVYRLRERPLTQVGFEAFVYKNHGFGIEQYFKNQGGLYTEFIPICSRIVKERTADQIDGGMTGIYNTSITQRLNGLTENSNVKTDGTLNVNYGRIPQRPASESGQDDTGTETV